MNDLLTSLPPWAKLTLLLLVWFGPLLLITGFFLGQDAGWIPSEHRTSLALAAQTKERLDQHMQQDKELLSRLMTGFRVICMNSATRREELERCQLIQ